MVLSKDLEAVRTHYRVLMHSQDISAKILYRATTRIKAFTAILSEAQTASIEERIVLRKRMQELLHDKYEDAKMQGVLQYHVIFPNNTSFLRMHKPSKFDDDLTEIRDDIRYVNRTKKPIRAFTRGRTAHGFRNTFPLFDNSGKHIGVLEIAFSSDNLQENLTKINDIHTHFLIKSNIFTAKAWKRNDKVLQYTQSAEHKDYMIAMTTSHSFEKCVTATRKRLEPLRRSIDKNFEKDESFTNYTACANGAYCAAVFLAIKSVEGETIGYMLGNQFHYRVSAFLFSLIVGFFIFSGIQARNKQLALNKELEKLNANLEERVNEALEKNTKQHQLLQEQSKLAAMGEMIGAIAHQWRQPLNELGLGIQNLKYDYKAGNVNEVFLREFIEKSKKDYHVYE